MKRRKKGEKTLHSGEESGQEEIIHNSINQASKISTAEAKTGRWRQPALGD